MKYAIFDKSHFARWGLRMDPNIDKTIVIRNEGEHDVLIIKIKGDIGPKGTDRTCPIYEDSCGKGALFWYVPSWDKLIDFTKEELDAFMEIKTTSPFLATARPRDWELVTPEQASILGMTADREDMRVETREKEA